jgi:hypothetical protein
MLYTEFLQLTEFFSLDHPVSRKTRNNPILFNEPISVKIVDLLLQVY